MYAGAGLRATIEREGGHAQVEPLGRRSARHVPNALKLRGWLGLILSVVVHSAGVQDRQGARRVVWQMGEGRFPRM